MLHNNVIKLTFIKTKRCWNWHSHKIAITLLTVIFYTHLYSEDGHVMFLWNTGNSLHNYITYKTDGPNLNFHHCKNPKASNYTVTRVFLKFFTDTVIISRLKADALHNVFKFLTYTVQISNSYSNIFCFHSLQNTEKNAITNPM